MISVQEADHLVSDHITSWGTTTVSLDDAAGRVLREDVAADRDYPPFDRVTMDGAAICFEALASGGQAFKVLWTQAAGDEPKELTSPEGCIEIMTGAALPRGADTVIRYEDLDMGEGSATIREGLRVRQGQNIHLRGSDRREGELIVPAGTRLGVAHVAALASVGKARICVAKSPRVVFLSTGNELVDIEDGVLPHQIRQSNASASRAALIDFGVQYVQVLREPDDESRLRGRIDEALQSADLLLLSGGVSAGTFDTIPRLLAEAGVSQIFHKVRQKPGKPLWFGISQDGKPVFGLPGNPVSTLVCLRRYVLPYIASCCGETARARTEVMLTECSRHKEGFTQFVPVRVEGMSAFPVPSNGSGDFLSLVPSDGFAEVGPDLAEPGAVPFYSWSRN